MENLLNEDELDLDVIGTPIDTNADGLVQYDTITIEQIADLFGVQQVLGCGASFNEYSAWYNALGIESDSIINVEEMYADYVSICEAEGTYYIPPSVDTPKEKSLKGLAVIGGALLLYGALKK